jgi:hypothetical protein
VVPPAPLPSVLPPLVSLEAGKVAAAPPAASTAAEDDGGAPSPRKEE